MTTATISPARLPTAARQRLRRFGAGEVAEQQAAQAEEQAQEEPEAAGDPDRGRELYFANGCAVCHGDQGEGGIGPTIASTSFTVDQVIQQYRAPRGFMPAFPADLVPDADVGEVHAWLQTLPLPEKIVPGEGTP